MGEAGGGYLSDGDNARVETREERGSGSVGKGSVVNGLSIIIEDPEEGARRIGVDEGEENAVKGPLAEVKLDKSAQRRSPRTRGRGGREGKGDIQVHSLRGWGDLGWGDLGPFSLGSGRGPGGSGKSVRAAAAVTNLGGGIGHGMVRHNIQGVGGHPRESRWAAASPANLGGGIRHCMIQHIEGGGNAGGGGRGRGGWRGHQRGEDRGRDQGRRASRGAGRRLAREVGGA